ncbi:Demethylmenaquinone methyltransferase [Microbacterium azadirachtae]|uniref:Demethylmenaquinone methyltransferase n=1 Tax=Microbacterium azadirachtae TaxID=582680 RepID=A0A0F0LHN0_9MICO|nr:Demethylmenaquinone methyltransferase [Microbacterium azadirachtae]
MQRRVTTTVRRDHASSERARLSRDRERRWNHNIHFHRLVTDAIPAGATSAIDVGTGDGALAGELRAVMSDVTGIDLDQGVLARAQAEHPGVAWVHGDVMTHDFGRTFDVVASIATLHHFDDMRAALRRLGALTSPGGVLVVVGLARSTSLGDHAHDALGIAQHQWCSRTRTYWEHSAPTVWPPPHSYSEVRESAAQELPEVRWKRFALWRYALTWQRPE